MKSLMQIIEELSSEDKNLNNSLLNSLRTHHYKKKYQLLVPGQQSNRIYFIEKGLVRGYYIKDGRDITTGFMKENEFVISPVSFFGQKPSFEYIELLEDSILYSLTFEQLEKLYDTFPSFNRVGRILTQDYYVRSELRTHCIRANSAEERYAFFVNYYSAVLGRINNRHIASFIGLTPETLSRVRARKQHSIEALKQG